MPGMSVHVVSDSITTYTGAAMKIGQKECGKDYTEAEGMKYANELQTANPGRTLAQADIRTWRSLAQLVNDNIIFIGPDPVCRPPAPKIVYMPVPPVCPQCPEPQQVAEAPTPPPSDPETPEKPMDIDTVETSPTKKPGGPKRPAKVSEATKKAIEKAMGQAGSLVKKLGAVGASAGIIKKINSAKEAAKKAATGKSEKGAKAALGKLNSVLGEGRKEYNRIREEYQ